VTKENTGKALPTVTGFAAMRAIAVLRQQKIATAHLLHAAGLSGYEFGQAEGGRAANPRVSAMAQGKFLEHAAAAIDDSAFGLHLAEETDPRDAGILYYVASSAHNIGEALRLLARYFRIVNEAAHLRSTPSSDGVAVAVQFVGVARHGLRQNVEFGIAVILKALREVTGRNIRPIRAAFAHARNSDLREFERFYLCPVEFGATSDLLEFTKDTLAIPLITADAKLLGVLQPFCDAAAKERRTETGTVRSAVESEVEKQLPHGRASAQSVAKALAFSGRTLSRRLADEGTTYVEVVDQLRRSLALQYLREPSMSVSQIAWLLGYEDSGSFNHAFRRWTGQSPSAARNEKRLSAPC
jgi:AraC-like DNA-binding protein